MSLFERFVNLTQDDFKTGQVTVSQETCDGCKACVQVCPASAMELVGRKARMVAGANCISCGDCMAACATDSIRITAFWNYPSGLFRTQYRRQEAGLQAFPRRFRAPASAEA